MREAYDIKNLSPWKNSYAKKLKKQIIINTDNDTIDFLKSKARNPAFRTRRWFLYI